MERICEPELMEDPQQARAYADTDFSRSDRAMLERLLDHHGADLPEPIIDLGCGPGNITFLLAERCPTATVLGVDGSAAMLAIAEQRRLTAGDPGARVRFLRERLPCASLAGRRFGTLVSNSLLHHLHDPLLLWRTVQERAAPGAVVFMQDLRRPADEAELERHLRRHGASLLPLVRSDYGHSLRAAFTCEEVVAQLAQVGLDAGLVVQAIDDQYLCVQGRLPGRLTP